MLGQHFLAGAYHGFTALQCARYDLESRSRLIDHLDDHIDLRIVEDSLTIGCEQGGGGVPLLIRMFDTYSLDRCLETGSLLQYLVKTFSHNAETKKSDRQLLMRFHFYLNYDLFTINMFLKRRPASSR